MSTGTKGLGTDGPDAGPAAGAPFLTVPEIIEKLDGVYDCSDCWRCKEEIGVVIEQLRRQVESIVPVPKE